MKTKLFDVVLVASAVTIAQANPGSIPAAKGTVNRGAVARSAPAVRAPMQPGGVSSFRSTPMWSQGSRPVYSGQRTPMWSNGSRPVYSGQRSPSFGMRSLPSSAYRPPFYSSRASFTRSGPYTVATIPRASGLQPTRLPLQQRDRVAAFANRRNPAVARVWNQQNTGTQFRNGNNLRNANNLRNGNNLRNTNNFQNGNRLRNGKNQLRRDWQKHVFGQRSGNWHRDWDRNCNHWWNGHQCSFINGS